MTLQKAADPPYRTNALFIFRPKIDDGGNVIYDNWLTGMFLFALKPPGVVRPEAKSAGWGESENNAPGL